MERALVVVDETDSHRELLREAGNLASGAGADLVLFAVISEGEYEKTFETIEKISETEGTSYGEDTVLDGARSFAGEFGREVLDDVEVEFETDAAVFEDGERADRILGAADRNGCDHVFIVGRQRSPTGKAIFGNTAQSVILNFDGPVTIRTS